MRTQDLHIHTTYSTTDHSVVPEQAVTLVAAVGHAQVVGISDHFECLVNGHFESYTREIRGAALKVGVEVDGHPWVDQAVTYPVDDFVFHCRDQQADYRSLDRLLATGKAVIDANRLQAASVAMAPIQPLVFHASRTTCHLPGVGPPLTSPPRIRVYFIVAMTNLLIKANP